MINMGRGNTVDEDALYSALKEEKFKLYISDVFSKEPLPVESPFWDLENIIITPHICGPNVNYSEKLYPILHSNIYSFISKKSMKNIYSFTENY